MTLAKATLPGGRPVRLKGEAPFSCDRLSRLAGVPFDLPADDPWVLGQGSTAHTYVDAARQAWADFPEWMDYLDASSPAWGVKTAARDVYLHWWREHLRPGRVLDVGCGIGRMTHPFLDVGASVVGVDADLESLRRCAWYAAGRAGSLDLRWSSAHALPDWTDVDVAIAVEVLCYVPEIEAALAGIAERLKPGGVLLISMEGVHGWAVAPDAPEGGLSALFSEDHLVHLPGDRWVRTVDEADLRGLLGGAGLVVEQVVPVLYVPEGPFERMAPDGVGLEEILEVEERCRKHPVFRPLNRAWAAVGRKPR